MDDNRVIAPINDDFQFNMATSVDTGTRISNNVQYSDQVPQVNSAASSSDAVNRVSDVQNLMSPNSDLLGNLGLMDIVQMFVVYAFIGAAALSAIFIFVGGVSFILSGGNDEKIKQAINTIRYSIIGLIVTILSFTFVSIVGRLFNLNFMGFLSYERIKNDINRLVEPFSVDNQNSNFEVRN